MTKLQIISRQWSSIYDLLLYIKDKEKAKPLEDIQQDLDIIEYSCRKYADVDDEEISMENEQISRAEHEEFRKRIEAEDNRQNRRIEILENSVQQLQELVTSVQTLANNMENMVKEQGQQSARLEALESRDGEKWRTVTSYLLTAILGIAVEMQVVNVVLNGSVSKYIAEFVSSTGSIFKILTSYARLCMYA